MEVRSSASSLHTEYQRSEFVYYSNFQNKTSIMPGYSFLKLNVQSMIKMKLRRRRKKNKKKKKEKKKKDN